MYWFSLDNERCDRYGIIVDKRTAEAAPEMKYTKASSNYIDGAFFTNYGTYEIIEKRFECNFVEENPDKWHEHWRSVKRWLLREHDAIRYSDDIGVFRKVLHTSISESERQIEETGNFTVIFTLQPYEYYDKGLIKHTVKDCEYNIYSTSHPIYIVSGNKPTLTVNGNTFKVFKNGTSYIDTDLMICYDDQNNFVQSSGFFEDIYLQEGMNEISVDNGTLLIVPNWRSI